MTLDCRHGGRYEVPAANLRGAFRRNRRVQACGEHHSLIDELTRSWARAGGVRGDAAYIHKPALSRGHFSHTAPQPSTIRRNIEKDPPQEGGVIRAYRLLSRRRRRPAHSARTLRDGTSPSQGCHHGRGRRGAVRLSVRYITGRFAGQAIDLVDEASLARAHDAADRAARIQASGGAIAKLTQRRTRPCRGGASSGAARSARHGAAPRAKALEIRLGRQGERRAVTEADVAAWSPATGIPGLTPHARRDERLLHLEEDLSRRIDGEEEAVRSVPMRSAVRGRPARPKRPSDPSFFSGRAGWARRSCACALRGAHSGARRHAAVGHVRIYMRRTRSRASSARRRQRGYDEGGQLTRRVAGEALFPGALR
jgi:ATP-dependent Clp protease ATP-binding subunit ClpC